MLDKLLVFCCQLAPSSEVSFPPPKQYLEMRREAFRNDGITPTNANAYDLLVWDTTRYTDLRKLMIGGTAKMTDLQASVSGGNELTRFLISGGYHYESTVYPGDYNDQRGSMHFHIQHASSDQKLNLQLKGSYSANHNRIP